MNLGIIGCRVVPRLLNFKVIVRKIWQVKNNQSKKEQASSLENVG